GPCQSGTGSSLQKGPSSMAPSDLPMAIQASTDTAGSGPLRISTIETIPIRVPLAREFRGSHYRMTHRATLIVRLRTSDGIVGEAYVGDEDAGAKEIETVLREEITPRVLGMDVLATERCWQAAYPATFDILRDRRIGLVALA